MSDDLKACPFCGRTGEMLRTTGVINVEGRGYSQGVCGGCEAGGPPVLWTPRKGEAPCTMSGLLESAAARWNIRTLPPVEENPNGESHC